MTSHLSFFALALAAGIGIPIMAAMNANLGLRALTNVIHPYPTQAEAIRKVADQYNRTRLTPLIARLFKAWFGWQRR